MWVEKHSWAQGEFLWNKLTEISYVDPVHESVTETFRLNVRAVTVYKTRGLLNKNSLDTLQSMSEHAMNLYITTYLWFCIMSLTAIYVPIIEIWYIFYCQYTRHWYNITVEPSGEGGVFDSIHNLGLRFSCLIWRRKKLILHNLFVF